MLKVLCDWKFELNDRVVDKVKNEYNEELLVTNIYLYKRQRRNA